MAEKQALASASDRAQELCDRLARSRASAPRRAAIPYSEIHRSTGSRSRAISFTSGRAACIADGTTRSGDDRSASPRSRVSRRIGGHGARGPGHIADRGLAIDEPPPMRPTGPSRNTIRHPGHTCDRGRSSSPSTAEGCNSGCVRRYSNRRRGPGLGSADDTKSRVGVGRARGPHSPNGNGNRSATSLEAVRHALAGAESAQDRWVYPKAADDEPVQPEAPDALC